MGRSKPYKITIIAPTCFYYQAPLFRALASDAHLDLTVYFCSDEGISGKDVEVVYGNDKGWGVEEELLEGYHFEFLRNYAPWGSYLKSLVGLVNFGIWNKLRRERPDIVVIMSWMNPTWWLTFVACQRYRIPIFFMTDANFYAEQLKRPWRSWFKRILLGKFLFPATSGFLYAGSANKRLYTEFGVPENKLVPFAYSWGYSALIEKSNKLQDRKTEFRRELGLPEDAVVILYCGRLSFEKGLLELLEAYKLMSSTQIALVLVGDGHLQKQMKDFTKLNNIDSVYFMGFQKRNDIGKFYTSADFLVLPSRRETWGLVVNEALCFSLPVVVSDQVGAGVDLVIPGLNGHIYPAGDVAALAERMSRVIELPEEDRQIMGRKSKSLIREWSNRNLAGPLIEFLDSNLPNQG